MSGNRVIEYVIKLKNLLSGGLTEAASDVKQFQQTLKMLDDALKKRITSAIADAKKAFKALGVVIRALPVASVAAVIGTVLVGAVKLYERSTERALAATMRLVEKSQEARRRIAELAQYDKLTPINVAKSDASGIVKSGNFEDAKMAAERALAEYERLKKLSGTTIRRGVFKAGDPEQDKLQERAFEAKRISEIYAEAYEKMRKSADALTEQQKDLRGELARVGETEQQQEVRLRSEIASLNDRAASNSVSDLERENLKVQSLEKQLELTEAINRAAEQEKAKKERAAEEVRRSKETFETNQRDRRFAASNEAGKLSMLAKEQAEAKTAGAKAKKGGNLAEYYRQADVFQSKGKEIREIVNAKKPKDKKVVETAVKESSGSYLSDLMRSIAFSGPSNMAGGINAERFRSRLLPSGLPGSGGLKGATVLRNKQEELLFKIERHLDEQSKLWRDQLGGN